MATGAAAGAQAPAVFASAATMAGMGPAPSAPPARNAPPIVTIMMTVPSRTMVSTGREYAPIGAATSRTIGRKVRRLLLGLTECVVLRPASWPAPARR
ncbi:hypothetical protein SHIRM173S_09495 [Streptomyces hirsutus]